MPMKKSNYNIEDEQFKETIELLKQLPRIGAPPDFEMNLKRKLNSKKYQEKKGFFYYFNLKRPLVPASALAVCAVIAFFMVSKHSELENPFTKIPPQRNNAAQTTNQQSNDAKKKNFLIDPNNISSNDVIIKKEPVQKSTSTASRSGKFNSHATRNSDEVASSDRNVNRLRNLDFGGFGSNLDKSLRAKPDPNGGDQYGNPGENVNFGGFNLVPGQDRELDMLRSRMDSLKRMWLRGNR